MTFTNILSCPIELQQEVRNWRNQNEIRKNMYSDHIISSDEHNQWLTSLHDASTNHVYIAFNDNIPIGLVSINNYKPLWSTADWAFYLNPDYLSHKGLGAALEYHFLNFIFNKFELTKLNCEVLEINPLVVKLHQKFGFIIEGIKRKNIIKDNKRIDVVLLGILYEEWIAKRPFLEKIINRI